jgi:hypothetical protein
MPIQSGYRIAKRIAPSLAAVSVLLLAGCSTMNGAIEAALSKKAKPSAQPEAQASSAPAPSADAQPQSKGEGNAAPAYRYQFDAFYGGMWSMGWLGYGDANYMPGQGTLWSFSGAGVKSQDSATLERALLKVNADKSQWWRFKLDSGKTSLLYEFLVGSDGEVRKVRYRDPDTKAVDEFIPDRNRQQPARASESQPKTRADMAGYLVGKEEVRVKGGSFLADHYLYVDGQGKGKSEFWLSDKVPGSMLKTVYAAKDDKTSTGELLQIESGVTTALASY